MLNRLETPVAKPDAQIEREIHVTRGIVALPGEALAREQAKARLRAGFDALSRQPAQHSTEIRFVLNNREGLPRILFTRKAWPEADIEILENALDGAARDFDAWLGFMWPDVVFTAESDAPAQGRSEFAVRPVVDPSLQCKSAKPVLTLASERPQEPLLEPLAAREFDIAAALEILAPFAPCELVLRLSPIVRDGRVRRALDKLDESCFRAALLKEAAAVDVALVRLFIDTLRKNDCHGVRIEALTRGRQGLSPFAIDLISFALFGVAADRTDPGVGALDLRGIWPAGWTPPPLLPARSEVEWKRSLAARDRSVRSDTGRRTTLGCDLSGQAISLSARDRARHLYVIGATGTGKSTLLLDMIRQDMDAGEGVIVIDPHGDLADAAHRVAPARRRSELLWCDFADIDSIPVVNILQGQGALPELERNYVCNQLVQLFSRILYRGVPEAFGPMFETYFRNGLMLLMDGGGAEATLMDFERVFHDAGYRKALLDHCGDEKVQEFWRDIAARATWDEIRLENITPYIVSKLAQLTGNPLIRRVIGGKKSTLDFRAAMDRGGIVLLKLAKGIIGEYDTTLVATLMAIRIAQAGMARAVLDPDKRRPARVYIDEFQACAGDALGDMLAESRKYGISLSLANQSLSQVNGKGCRSDAGEAALANAANLVAFRLGAPDAIRLAPWFEPEIEWRRLCNLPDFHAAVRALDDGYPMPSRSMIIEPPSR